MQTSLDTLLALERALPTSVLTGATRQFSDALDAIPTPEGIYVYNPIAYGRVAHERYLALAASGPRPVLFVAMNPGPWGMVQTALPFGDVRNATEIQRLAGPIEVDRLLDARAVAAVRKAHLRPIEGYACSRAEVSGTRFWSEFGGADRPGGAPPAAPTGAEIAAVLRQAFIMNICPLAFFGPPDATKDPKRSPGVNLTPDKLPKPYRDAVLAPCREYFGLVVRVLQPRGIVCFGRWAERTVKAWAEELTADPLRRGEPGDENLITNLRLEEVEHPSPRAIASSAGWKPAEALRKRGFWTHCGIE